MFPASSLLFLTGVLFLGVPTPWRKLASALFLLSALAFMISCGGSSGSGGGGGGDGGGGGTSYSIVVQVSSGVVQVSSGNYGKDAGTITLTVK